MLEFYSHSSCLLRICIQTIYYDDVTVEVNYIFDLFALKQFISCDRELCVAGFVTGEERKAINYGQKKNVRFSSFSSFLHYRFLKSPIYNKKHYLKKLILFVIYLKLCTIFEIQ